MAILFSAVARSTTILAKYASCAGNFNEVVDNIISKISPEADKLTYTHGSYLFHYVTSSHRITYLCITDEDYERSRAFQYLSEIQRRFEMQYGSRSLTALPYAMDSEFSKVLASQIRRYASISPSEVDKIDKVQGQVDELKGIMVKNIDSLTSRGEQLELLLDKTEDLNTNSVSFKRTSSGLARSMWWKDVKLTVIILFIVIIVSYVIVSICCGGLDWKNVSNELKCALLLISLYLKGGCISLCKNS